MGSKNFTEQVILGEILARMLEDRGVAVDRKLNLGGTFICHQAVVAGDVDVYFEYTGTALAAILKLPLTADAGAAFATVKTEYAKRFGLDWGSPLGFNNTFALVMRGAHARALGVTTISDLAPHAKTLRAGFGYEFLERLDGLAGLNQAYGFEFGIRPREMELSLIYPALAQNEVDVVAGNSTDGLIEKLGLVVLVDDRSYFPPYEAAPVVRPDALLRVPALGSVLTKLASALSAASMRKLNEAVDSGRRSPRDVAADWVSGAFTESLESLGPR